MLTRSSDRVSKILAANLHQTTFAVNVHHIGCVSSIFGTHKTKQTSQNTDLVSELTF